MKSIAARLRANDGPVPPPGESVGKARRWVFANGYGVYATPAWAPHDEDSSEGARFDAWLLRDVGRSEWARVRVDPQASPGQYGPFTEAGLAVLVAAVSELAPCSSAPLVVFP